MIRRSSAPLAILVAATLASTPLDAAELDAALPTDVVIGPTGASATSAQGSALSLTGRSPHRLPLAPRKAFSRPVGAIGQPPAVGTDGSLYLALVAPELLRLDTRGEEVFRARLGSAAAVSGPAILADGHVAILTSASTVVFVTPRGRVSNTVPLPRSVVPRERGASADQHYSLLPLVDGAVLVAGGDSVAIVERGGRVRWSLVLPERIAAELVPVTDGVALLGVTGALYLVDSARGLRRLAELPSLPVGPLQPLDQRRLLAPMGSGRVSSIDLRTRAVAQHLGDPLGADIDAPLAIAADARVYATSSDGALLGFDARGAELFRDAVDSQRVLTMPTSRGPSSLGGSAPPRGRLAVLSSPAPARVSAPAPLVDAEGNVAVLRPSGRLVVRWADGSLRLVTDRSCASPLALAPIKHGKLAVVCREGLIVGYDDAPE